MQTLAIVLALATLVLSPRGLDSAYFLYAPEQCHPEIRMDTTTGLLMRCMACCTLDHYCCLLDACSHLLTDESQTTTHAIRFEVVKQLRTSSEGR